MARQSANGEAKDAAINFRTTSRLRDVLETFAKAQNRSLAQEIEARLLKSIDITEQPEEKWDYPTKSYARIVGKCLDHISKISGTTWVWTKAGREAAKASVANIFEAADLMKAPAEDVHDKKSSAELTNSAVAVAKYLIYQMDFDTYAKADQEIRSKRSE